MHSPGQAARLPPSQPCPARSARVRACCRSPAVRAPACRARCAPRAALTPPPAHRKLPRPACRTPCAPKALPARPSAYCTPATLRAPTPTPARPSLLTSPLQYNPGTIKLYCNTVFLQYNPSCNTTQCIAIHFQPSSLFSLSCNTV